MYNVLTLNKISPNGTSRLGDNYNVGDDVENPAAVLVRSASMHDMEMPESLLAIARCGAGTNNIPKDVCADKGIVVFNTPGANANAVKELVLAGLFMSSRKVVEGIEWAKTLKGNGDAVGKMAEKGKGQFVGPEIMGKTLGVIGLGAIGILVANAAVALGMKVIGYDPFLSVNNALKLDPTIKVYANIDDIFTNSDYSVKFSKTSFSKISVKTRITAMKEQIFLVSLNIYSHLCTKTKSIRNNYVHSIAKMVFCRILCFFFVNKRMQFFLVFVYLFCSI